MYFLSSSVLADCLVLRNPLLRQAPKTLAEIIKDTKNLKTYNKMEIEKLSIADLKASWDFVKGDL